MQYGAYAAYAKCAACAVCAAYWGNLVKTRLESAMALKVQKVRINDFGIPGAEGAEGVQEGSTPLRPYLWGRVCGLRRRAERSASLWGLVLGNSVGKGKMKC